MARVTVLRFPAWLGPGRCPAAAAESDREPVEEAVDRVYGHTESAPKRATHTLTISGSMGDPPKGPPRRRRPSGRPPI
jgi:hypothetical protein